MTTLILLNWIDDLYPKFFKINLFKKIMKFYFRRKLKLSLKFHFENKNK